MPFLESFDPFKVFKYLVNTVFSYSFYYFNNSYILFFYSFKNSAFVLTKHYTSAKRNKTNYALQIIKKNKKSITYKTNSTQYTPHNEPGSRPRTNYIIVVCTSSNV